MQIDEFRRGWEFNPRSMRLYLQRLHLRQHHRPRDRCTPDSRFLLLGQ